MGTMRRLLLGFLLLVTAAACAGGGSSKLAVRLLPSPPVAPGPNPAIAADGDALLVIAERTVLRFNAFGPSPTWERVIDDVPVPAGTAAGWRGRLWYLSAEGGGPQLVNVALAGDARLERRRLDGADPAAYDLVAGLSALWLVSGANAWRIDANGVVQPLLTANVARLQALGELPDGTFLALAPDEQRVLAWTPGAAWSPAAVDAQLFTGGTRQTTAGLLMLSNEGVVEMSSGFRTKSTRIERPKGCTSSDLFATDIGSVVQACDLVMRSGSKTTRIDLPAGDLVAFAGPRGRPVFVRDGRELLLLS